MNVKISTVILILGSLSGCDSSSVKDVDACDGVDTVMCKTLIAESRCANERKRFVLADIDRVSLDDGKSIYEKLVANSFYNQCIESASNIEFIDPEERYGLSDKPSYDGVKIEINESYDEYRERLSSVKSRRVESMIFSYNELKLEESRIVNRSEPDLLYWKWTRLNDSKARDELMKAFEDGKDLNYQALYFLSSHYLRKDKAKARRMLVDALLKAPKTSEESSGNGSEFLGLGSVTVVNVSMDVQILEALSSISFKEQRMQETYFYIQMLRQIKEVNVGYQVREFERNHSKLAEEINEMAIDTYDKLVDGSLTQEDFVFNASSF